MRRTRGWLIVSVVLLASAYMAGFWPERQRARAARDRVALLEARIAELEARVRLAELLGLLLRLSDSVVARNYGDASVQATVYYDRVGSEMLAAGDTEAGQVLQQIHQTRDRVVAGLARTDPGVIVTLTEQEHALRRALAFPVPDRIPAAPVQTAAEPPAPPPPAQVR